MFYLQRGNNRYFEWKRKYQIYQKFMASFFSKELDPGEFINGMKTLKGSFLFIEKFQKRFNYEDKRYFFVKKEIEIDGLTIIFENDSFAIIDLRI